MGINDKYGKNPNLWRRVYPTGARRAPKNVTVNSIVGGTQVIDLNRTVRHRDFYEVNKYQYMAPSGEFGSYEEGVITILNSDEGLVVFDKLFDGTPVVVFTIDEADPSMPNTENVNVFGTFVNPAGATVKLSAPFSGQVRYRAIYSDSYPILCTSPYTSSMWVSAGVYQIPQLDNTVIFNAPYAALPSTPTLFLQTTYDNISMPSYNQDIHLSVNTLADNLAISDMSTAAPGIYIHYIAYV